MENNITTTRKPSSLWEEWEKGRFALQLTKTISLLVDGLAYTTKWRMLVEDNSPAGLHCFKCGKFDTKEAAMFAAEDYALDWVEQIRARLVVEDVLGGDSDKG